jgi:hypothetical protein
MAGYISSLIHGRCPFRPQAFRLAEKTVLPEIPREEFAAALDACVAEVLWEAGITRPPVDAFSLARQLELVVAHDREMSHRARFVRLAQQSGSGGGQAAIVVGPAERPERAQWAVAHEIGESIACRVFETLRVLPHAVPIDTRECVASLLAGRLLLPRPWFSEDGRGLGWDLPKLKERYATASHELIGRRMLEMRPPIVITVCDLGRLHWRRGNISPGVPPMLSDELEVWRCCHATGRPMSATPDAETTGLERIRCWAIHEPDWKREILRSEVAEV